MLGSRDIKSSGRGTRDPFAVQSTLHEREIERKKGGKRVGAPVKGSSSLQDLKNAPPTRGLEF